MENKKILSIALVILASASLIVGVYYFAIKNGISLTNLKLEPGLEQKESSKVVRGKISNGGKIYLSLLTLDEGDKIFKRTDNFREKRDGISAFSDVYYYDLENGALKKISRDLGDKKGYNTGVISPDKKQMALAGFDNVSGEWQIYLADADGKNKKKITKSSSLHKELPRWSSDQKNIVFQANSEDKRDMGRDDIYAIENWNVYMTDLEGNERMIFPGGINPIFLPDDRLLVLGQSGLMLFDKKSNYTKGTVVWPVVKGTKTNQSMRVSVSGDGQYIAWAETRARKTHVAKVASWGPPMVFEKLKTFDGILICPVFSPDDKYLALLEVLLDSSVTAKNYDYYGHYNHRVNVYDLPALLNSSQNKIEPKITFSLNDYFFGSVEITDWAQ